ncbi:hypothetical protein SprV_0200605300 [Sparganum proliferum]
MGKVRTAGRLDLLYRSTNSILPLSDNDSLSLILNTDLRQSFSWIFVVADVPHGILGSDFLAKFDLLIDCRRARLLDRTNGLFVRGQTPFTTPTNLSVLDTDISSPFRQLLLSHPNIINPQFHSGEVQHVVVHHIRTSGPPVFARPRRLALEGFHAAKAEFERMLQLGIIRPSESPWASPLHMVPRATSGDWRPCGDYSALNNTTLPDRYPVPNLQGFVEALFSKAVSSNTDLMRDFHQIPVASEDIPKTAIITPSGLFEFIRMFIDYVVRGLSLAYAHFDDLWMASWNVKKHKEHLVLVFDRLGKFGVINNPPSSYRTVLTSFCRSPTYFLVLKGSLDLTGETLNAFEMIMNYLADAALLPPSAPDAQLSLMVDVSNVAVGVVLQQRLAGPTRPLVFLSKKLLPTETCYSTFDRELPAIYLAVKPFRHFLEGRDFTVFTNHKPLTFALRSHSGKYIQRQITHLGHISQFTTDIRHIDCTKNEVADMLSRPSLSCLQLSHGIDLGAMAAEQ